MGDRGQEAGVCSLLLPSGVWRFEARVSGSAAGTFLLRALSWTLPLLSSWDYRLVSLGWDFSLPSFPEPEQKPPLPHVRASVCFSHIYVVTALSSWPCWVSNGCRRAAASAPTIFLICHNLHVFQCSDLANDKIRTLNNCSVFPLLTRSLSSCHIFEPAA